MSHVWFFQHEDVSQSLIRERFGDSLMIKDEAYWDRVDRAQYATLIRLDHVRAIAPIDFSKRDRNAWVVFE